GMGEVYRATDTRLGRSVALKILPGDWAQDSERKLRFEREARTVAGLNHPHICALYDVGSQDGIDFLVMEYLEGETLAELLGRRPAAGLVAGRPLRSLRSRGLEDSEIRHLGARPWSRAETDAHRHLRSVRRRPGPVITIKALDRVHLG